MTHNRSSPSYYYFWYRAGVSTPISPCLSFHVSHSCRCHLGDPPLPSVSLTIPPPACHLNQFSLLRYVRSRAAPACREQVSLRLKPTAWQACGGRLCAMRKKASLPWVEESAGWLRVVGRALAALPPLLEAPSVAAMDTWRGGPANLPSAAWLPKPTSSMATPPFPALALALWGCQASLALLLQHCAFAPSGVFAEAAPSAFCFPPHPHVAHPWGPAAYRVQAGPVRGGVGSLQTGCSLDRQIFT